MEPALPAQAMQTYEISSPISTHTRRATCEEVTCLAMANGWKSKIDESTTLGQRQAAYIRTSSRRKFEAHREGGVTVFVFAPGQRCFNEHRKTLDRPAHFLVKGGDFRGNPLGLRTRVHERPELWVEDMSETLGKVNDIKNRG